MEANLRFVLIVLGAMAIAGLLFHGLWTIRRNAKKTQQLIDDQEAAKAREGLEVDSQGFDQYGVSRPVKLSGAEPELHEPEIAPEPHVELEPEQDVETADVKEPVLDKVPAFLQSTDDDNVEEPSHAPETVSEPVFEAPAETPEPEQKAVFASPVSKPKERQEPKMTIDLDDEQLEMNFGAGYEKQPKTKTKRTRKAAPKVSSELKPEPPVEDVVIFNVVMPEGQQMSGAALLPILLTLGLKYGDMNIFHRHEDSAGNGPVLFSLANMVNPGTFDIDNMETFVTKGLSLFMQLPMNGDESKALTLMHKAATTLAQEFGAQLLDSQRSVVTKQTVQHYQEKVREFKRKKLLAV